MDIAVIYISPNQLEYLEYLKNLQVKNFTILQIGRSEIFREIGRVFTIIDVPHGALVARQFFSNDEKIEKLIICGPLDFLKEAERQFSSLANEIFLYPEKQK